ncbi:ASKHA domain-containing protein [Clostridium sp. KNHs214]|uniref:ASKHA domain-containing protein n=1 Tax=Clostridium sp. KNHs214 TaxID=1540257 RepID=UPI000555D685|nr:ASKHA domain-containing protein [Clostridium sp. KNHs214]
MVKVVFKNENIEVQVEEGTKLTDCIRKANLHIETPCSGIGMCGKCKVKVVGELYPPTLEEKKFTHEKDNIRLACLARVKGDVEVELLNSKKVLKTINRGYSVEAEIDSSIKKVKLPMKDKKNSTPYVEFIDYNINSVDIYEKIAQLEKENDEEIQGVVCNNYLLDIGKYFGDILGVAIDIGTTGMSAYLVNLEDGEVLNKVSSLNPQTQYGGDVLTRISYCINNENGTEILRDTIVNKINGMVSELLDERFSRDNVYRIMIAANTTMLHLFLGVNPKSIARAPYRSVFLNELNFKGKDINISINPGGIVTLLPSASGYVGADIIAGVIAVGFNEKKHSSIFIDIGTNGEIVAISNGKLAATSTAAGPALEGMNIDCGCRAEEGAIDTFSIDEDFNINYTTIDNAPVKGICGSGLMDIAASLVKNNIVLSSGKFNSNLDERVKHRLRDKKFYITEEIYISQKDIRQIQLAKGAIATGVTMLLDEINVSIDEVEEAVIAGSFGYHINPESIMDISLIPKNFKGKITFVGNSSIEGARLALINDNMLRSMTAVKSGIEVLELSTKPKFQEYFVKELKF